MSGRAKSRTNPGSQRPVCSQIHSPHFLCSLHLRDSHFLPLPGHWLPVRFVQFVQNIWGGKEDAKEFFCRTLLLVALLKQLPRHCGLASSRWLLPPWVKLPPCSPDCWKAPALGLWRHPLPTLFLELWRYESFLLLLVFGVASLSQLLPSVLPPPWPIPYIRFPLLETPRMVFVFLISLWQNTHSISHECLENTCDVLTSRSYANGLELKIKDSWPQGVYWRHGCAKPKSLQ